MEVANRLSPCGSCLSCQLVKIWFCSLKILIICQLEQPPSLSLSLSKDSGCSTPHACSLRNISLSLLFLFEASKKRSFVDRQSSSSSSNVRILLVKVTPFIIYFFLFFCPLCSSPDRFCSAHIRAPSALNFSISILEIPPFLLAGWEYSTVGPWVSVNSSSLPNSIRTLPRFLWSGLKSRTAELW